MQMLGADGYGLRLWKKHMSGFRLDDALAPHLTCGQRDRLARAHVGIVGAGGLGSNCAMLLARTGVGHLVLADHDTVAPSNLNRQHFFPRHLGSPKVEALAEQLRELNPGLGLTLSRERQNADTVCALFRGCDVVVEAVDAPEIKRMLVEALLQAGHAVVSASGMAGWGGPDMVRRRMGRLVVVGDMERAVGPGMPPLAPRVVMAAALEADAVLELLLGPSPRVDTPTPDGALDCTER